MGVLLGLGPTATRPKKNLLDREALIRGVRPVGPEGEGRFVETARVLFRPDRAGGRRWSFGQKTNLRPFMAVDAGAKQKEACRAQLPAGRDHPTK